MSAMPAMTAIPTQAFDLPIPAISAIPRGSGDLNSG